MAGALEIPPRPDDVVLLAFHGHGRWRADRDDFYLVPMDGREDDPDSWISSRELAAWLSPLDARMVMILDTCYSGRVGSVDGWKPASMGSHGLGQLAWNKSMPLLIAAEKAETSDGTSALIRRLEAHAAAPAFLPWLDEAATTGHAMFRSELLYDRPTADSFEELSR